MRIQGKRRNKGCKGCIRHQRKGKNKGVIEDTETKGSNKDNKKTRK